MKNTQLIDCTIQARIARERVTIYSNSLAWFNREIASLERQRGYLQASLMRQSRGACMARLNKARGAHSKAVKALGMAIKDVEQGYKIVVINGRNYATDDGLSFYEREGAMV